MQPRSTFAQTTKTIIIKATMAWSFLWLSTTAFATTVQFQTNVGNFEVALFDEIAPNSVGNFLAYVNNNAYKNNVMHRSVAGFVLQGGGFSVATTDKITLSPIALTAAVTNEAKLSNVRGTIAYAKKAGMPNSATSQWFFNLQDNSSNLDYSNGGYTVFGQVINNGMTIINSIEKLDAYNLSKLNTEFTDTPMMDVFDGRREPTEEDFVVIYNIVILDADPKSASALNPKAISTQKSSGGSADMVFLLLLLSAWIFKKTVRRKNMS